MSENQLFCDGGVIQRNPSQIGGTWAARLVCDGVVVCENSGTITTTEAQMPAVTNNLTELLAIIRGLQMLPADWVGTVCSDSQISLGRCFWGWKWTEIPMWMHHEYQAQTKRLNNWQTFTTLLLDGHPTKAQLEAGKGKRGHAVSIHNVWCDSQCQTRAKQVLAALQAFEV